MLNKLLDNLQEWSIKALIYFGVALWVIIFLIVGFSFI